MQRIWSVDLDAMHLEPGQFQTCRMEYLLSPLLLLRMRKRAKDGGISFMGDFVALLPAFDSMRRLQFFGFGFRAF
jgi:hypothetical protein